MEPKNENNTEARRTKKMAFGIVIILAGLLLLAFNTGVFPFTIKHIIFSWPMLLIAIGIISLFGSDSRLPGIILITIGGFFLLPRITFFSFNFIHLFWPLLLIVVGLLILFRKGLRHPSHYRVHEHPGAEAHSAESGYINVDSIFSGSKQRVAGMEFKGGRISCVFGGVDLDLSQAWQPEGITTLDISVLFGGVNLVIPSDWNVQLKNTSILGGFSDKRLKFKENPDPSRTLVIRTSAVFGGGEIKSY
jgi:predicted membrane protein